jgi:hypothetical protein
MGAPATNEDTVRAYTEASAASDFDQLARLRHAEWQALWPQSGERVVGHACWAEIAQNYPGGHPEISLGRLVGSEDRWVVTPGNTVARIAGSGDFWWGEWRMRYPDGKVYECVTLIEMRDALIWRETVYWAEPFDAPDWRRPYVEQASPPPTVA